MATNGDSEYPSVSKELNILTIENFNCTTNPVRSKSLPLNDLYRLALNFYKEKEGKAIHLSYEDKLQLVAFSQQVAHGPLSEAILKLPPLGTLDVVGRDRRLAWQKLGNLRNDEAKAGFVELLSRLCPLFNAYIEAHRCKKDEEGREEKEMHQILEKEKQQQLQQEEYIKRQIKQALNRQTYDQFTDFAELQFPGDPEKQGTLVKKLQEQHYIQYMKQLQAMHNKDVTVIEEKNDKEEKIDVKVVENVDSVANRPGEDASQPHLASVSEALLPPNMWTRSDIEIFKQAVSQAEGDGIVRVGHGETVTVRVPTHKDGSRIFWEFATDDYDIGFGVYFEFGTPTSSEVSVHVYESDEEDADDLDDLDEDGFTAQDLEAGLIPISSLAKPLLTEVVPVYRRDCQTEVYAGSHQYPGEGVYLLKFDNSYSLWRSKTLYYRVFYSQ